VAIASVPPHPQILKAITRNPLKPIDALCELIDNAIDSFTDGDERGIDINQPHVQIILPTRSELNENDWSLRVVDNGPGLPEAGILRAITAGYSGNNPFDRLGLFGLGFNQATGKIGPATLMRSRELNSQVATHVEVDLEQMIENDNYEVEVGSIPGPNNQSHGTTVEIVRGWPQGEPNAEFINRLTTSHATRIRKQIGRIYATLIRERGIRISVNGIDVVPFYHCVWGDNRFVYQGKDKIPAVYRFDELIGTANYCTTCHRQAFTDNCDSCGPGATIKTREQRVKGWLGVQRYDHASEFGIDFIRNGRAILWADQEVLFNWMTAEGERVRDYPIDGPFGRFIGEVHLDHVPTDYLKQSFQQTSEEWQLAVSYLRGDSTLQPQNRKRFGEPENTSPMYRLYQGYRRVRKYGSGDLYPGYWPEGAKKASRIDRSIEQELLEKFRDRIPGYIDDSEWWKLVDQADHPPANTTLKECPRCNEQCFDDAISCLGCGHVFVGKPCVGCSELILEQADSCPLCATPQPISVDPWQCKFCGHGNAPATTNCAVCNRHKDAVDPLGKEYLESNSLIDSELSIAQFAIALPDDSQSAPMAITVQRMKPGFLLEEGTTRLPAVRYVEGASIKIYLDLSHEAYTSFGDRPEDIVSMELARWLLVANDSKVKAGVHQWSISNIYWQIHRLYWSSRLSLEPDQVKLRANTFFEELRWRIGEVLTGLNEAIYDEMSNVEKGDILKNLINQGEDPGHITALVADGGFYQYLPDQLIVMLVQRYPDRFFDRGIWTDAYVNIDLLGEQKGQVQQHLLKRYRLLLEDALNFLGAGSPDQSYTARADQTISLLLRNMTNA